MRILNTSDLVSTFSGVALALVLSAGAAAQSTSPPDSQPQSAPSTQTAPSPDQTPAPNQAPSNSAPSTDTQQAPPSSSGAQAGASSSGAHAGAQQGTGTQGSAQQQAAKSVDEELQLTDDQKKKIADVVDDENKQISVVRDDNSMNLQQKQQKVLQIRQEGTPKIKAILTPEQLQKLAAIQQRMREQQGTPEQPSQNPAPNSTPNSPPNSPH
jgi:hypothetical protein